jgi:hypothetical protein
MLAFRYTIAAQTVKPKPGPGLRLGYRRDFLLIAPICLTICLGIAVCAWGDDSGYLRVVGPAPLRFRPAPHPIITLPPPAPAAVEASPAPAIPGGGTPDFSVVPSLLPAPPLTAPVTVQAPTATTNETIIEPARPEDVVSPQMLLKYFNKSTNGNTTGVIAPIQFSPPQPIGAPSSTATYSN